MPISQQPATNGKVPESLDGVRPQCPNKDCQDGLMGTDALCIGASFTTSGSTLAPWSRRHFSITPSPLKRPAITNSSKASRECFVSRKLSARKAASMPGCLALFCSLAKVKIENGTFTWTDSSMWTWPLWAASGARDWIKIRHKFVSVSQRLSLA